MAFSRLVLASTALFSLSLAQTWTACNPLNVTCPANPALSTNATWNFQQQPGDSKIWNMTNGNGMSYGNAGAQFQITNEGMAPEIQSTFYLMFGTVTYEMQPAAGQGIISSMVLISDDLDEIDWEFKGGDTTNVYTNYYGKGKCADPQTCGASFPLPDGSAPQAGWHNYTLDWTADKLDWLVDGHLIRTLEYSNASGGSQYPQTPMMIRLGSWAGGDVKKNSNGTVQWAGGPTDFSKGPFNMFVRSVYAKDYSSGSEYVYSDHSGTWQSIQSKNGTSAAIKEMTEPHGVSGHWHALPNGLRVGIIVAGIAGLAVLVLAALGFCIWQGHKGKQEKAVADAQWEKEQAEFNHYRMQMMKGGFSSGGGGRMV